MFYSAKANFEKCVSVWNKHIYPDLFSLSRVFLIRLPCSSAAETCSLAWVCISPLMKTDGLGEGGMFFSCLAIIYCAFLKSEILQSSWYKYQTSWQRRATTFSHSPGCRVSVEMVTNEGMGGLRLHWQMTKKFTHASCLWACLFV